MTEPQGPFTVTSRGLASCRFPKLEDAHRHAKRLLDRDSIPSIITDRHGQQQGVYDLFLDPIEGGLAVPGVYTAEQAAR